MIYAPYFDDDIKNAKKRNVSIQPLFRRSQNYSLPFLRPDGGKRQSRAVPLILKFEAMAVSSKDIETLWKRICIINIILSTNTCGFERKFVSLQR